MNTDTTMKTNKAKIVFDVDTSAMKQLDGLLERLQDAADRLERLAADPPATVEIVRVPDLRGVEITITSRVVS